MTRVKCSVLDRPKEKIFTRIATRGVVKFFNVCNQEQKEIDTKIKEVGKSERKKEKVLSSIDKGSFLDRLKENGLDEDNSNKQDQNQPSWSVLRDDFIMGSKMKDWDNKNNAESEPEEQIEESDSEEEQKKTKTKKQNKNKKFKK